MSRLFNRLELSYLLLLIVPIACNAETLSIATFNCEFLNTSKVHIKFGLSFDIRDEPADVQAQWTDDFRAQKYTEAAQAVAQVIHQVNADVITLIEVGNSDNIIELNNAVASLGTHYTHVAVGNSLDTATQQNVAILSKFPLRNKVSPIPGRETYLQELDDPETETDTGISKGMEIEVTAHDNTFVLYALHFASERGGYEKDQQRIAQASIARRHMLPKLKAGELVIVAGDFNDKKGQPTLHRIRGLDDIHEDLIQTGLSKYFEADKIDTRWTYQYDGVRQQIDHILLSYSIKDVVKRSKGIQTRTLDHGNSLASDHHVLIVTLNLK